MMDLQLDRNRTPLTTIKKPKMTYKFSVLFLKWVLVYFLLGFVFFQNLQIRIDDINLPSGIKDIETLGVSIAGLAFTYYQIRFLYHQIRGKRLDNKRKEIQIREHLEKMKRLEEEREETKNSL